MMTDKGVMVNLEESRPFCEIAKKNGAGDEARTRDNKLGRLVLYQLSYSRSTLRLDYYR